MDLSILVMSGLWDPEPFIWFNCQRLLVPGYGTIEIFTIPGKRVFHHDQFLFSTGRPPFTLDISSFSNGLYLVVIHLDGKEYSGKFVKHE